MTSKYRWKRTKAIVKMAINKSKSRLISHPYVYEGVEHTMYVHIRIHVSGLGAYKIRKRKPRVAFQEVMHIARKK